MSDLERRKSDASRVGKIMISLSIAVLGGCASTNTFSDRDRIFLDALRGESLIEPDATSQRQDAAISAAKDVCRMMEDGQDPVDAILYIADLGVQQDRATSFVAVSALAYCPEYA
ncbi:DUF732 domain-containing protein [Geodermatophilus sp. URMC 63]